MMKIDIPQNAASVVGVLRANGHEAYVVGGCVRDALLGREPNDWDVTTSALPERTMELFTKTQGFGAIPTGIAHGTVTVRTKGESIEVTTFRIDGEYTDCRRPDHVDFTDSLRDDLARRDFTINAMAYSDECGLCDPYGGEADLAAGIIRCVGDPVKRFSEDALRIMRALRFSSVLGFPVEPVTAEAAISLRSQLSNIARERIHAELEKLIAGRDAQRVIREFFPIFCEILPELSGTDPAASGELVGRLHGASMPMLMAALFVGGGDARQSMTALRFPKSTVTRTMKILENYRTLLTDRISVRFFCRKVGMDFAAEVISFGIRVGTIPDSAEELLDKIIADGDCLSLAGLKISGIELSRMNVPKKQIGETLNQLLEAVMRGELENRRGVLKRAVRMRFPKQNVQDKERTDKQYEGSTSV